MVEDAEGNLEGLEAVIDKDFASALLAHDLNADLFVVSTGVEKVAIHFNQPNQRWLDQMTVTEARRYLAEGHFPKGSMGPKIEAIASFLEPGGAAARDHHRSAQPGPRIVRRDRHARGAGLMKPH